MLEVLEEGKLLGEEEEQRAALGVCPTRRAADTVDVLARIIRGVVLEREVCARQCV